MKRVVYAAIVLLTGLGMSSCAALDEFCEGYYRGKHYYDDALSPYSQATFVGDSVVLRGARGIHQCCLDGTHGVEVESLCEDAVCRMSN